MRVLASFDASKPKDKKTAYTVELDDGRTVDVMRKHYPGWPESSPHVYVMDPHDEDIDEREVLSFLRETHEDFASYSLEVKYSYSYKAIYDNCYSKEQALYIAEQRLKKSNKKDLETLQVYCNGKLYKDFLKERRKTRSR